MSLDNIMVPHSAVKYLTYKRLGKHLSFFFFIGKLKQLNNIRQFTALAFTTLLSLSQLFSHWLFLDYFSADWCSENAAI